MGENIKSNLCFPNCFTNQVLQKINFIGIGLWNQIYTSVSKITIKTSSHWKLFGALCILSDTIKLYHNSPRWNNRKFCIFSGSLSVAIHWDTTLFLQEQITKCLLGLWIKFPERGALFFLLWMYLPIRLLSFLIKSNN